MSEKITMSKRNLGKIFHMIDWETVFEYHENTEEDLEEFIELARSLGEDSEFGDWNFWRYLWSSCKNLSESFIRKHYKNIDWLAISIYQRLSEEFVNEYIEQLEFDYIIWHQDISLEFVIKHNLDVEEILKTNKSLSSINRESMEKYIKMKTMFN